MRTFESVNMVFALFGSWFLGSWGFNTLHMGGKTIDH